MIGSAKFGTGTNAVMAGLVPAILLLLRHQRRTWMPGNADKFTQSAQGRLLWPGMTSCRSISAADPQRLRCFAGGYGLGIVIS
jgi:hypothetical protein